MGLFQNILRTEWILGIVGLLFVLTWIFLILTQMRIKSFQQAYLSLQTQISGGLLDDLLKEALRQTQLLEEKVTLVETRLQKVELKLKASFSHAGMIRFNAFDNMGSDLSFAVAITNEVGDGLVISSINSREESRVYAKPLSKGESNYTLSKEEKEAISKALAGPMQ